jgi:hypothetical protein
VLLLLFQYTREENIIIGSSTSTFNPLMLRVDVTDAITLAELLEATRTAEAEALDNEAPFDELVRQMAHGDEGRSNFPLVK